MPYPILVAFGRVWRPEVARHGNFVGNFCVFFGKTTPFGENFKSLFRKFSLPRRSMLLRWNVIKFVRREIGEIVLYLRDQKQNRTSDASQTVATARIAPKIFQGQPPTFGSHYSRFHPNRFTFRGVIAERAKTVLLPHRVFGSETRLTDPRWRIAAVFKNRKIAI